MSEAWKGTGLRMVRLSQAAPDERRVLLEAYAREVYLPAFPDERIREDTSYWLNLLGSDPWPDPPQPLLDVILAIEGERILGGATIELYRTARAGFLTYIAVAEDARGKGIGRRLVAAARAWLDAVGGPDVPMLAETERFRDTGNEAEREATAIRQRRLSGLGARRVDFDYVMPPLRPGLSPHRLHLLALGEPPVEDQPIAAATVAVLVKELAAALGADLNAHPDTAAMMAELDRTEALALRPLPDRRFIEAPVFTGLDSTSFSYAFELSRIEAPDHDGRRKAFRLRAIHDDMARRHKQAYRALLKPIRSFLDDVTTGPAGANGRPLFFAASGAPDTSRERGVTLVRPPDWTYEYEDETTRLTAPGGKEVAFRLADSFCAFESGRLFYILSLTQPLRPEDSGDDEPDPIDEYGVLQLQQLAIHPETLGRDAGYLGFRLAGGDKPLSLIDLARLRLKSLEAADGEGISAVPAVVERYGLLSGKPSAAIDLARLRGLCVGIDNSDMFACSRRALQLEKHWRGEGCGAPPPVDLDETWRGTPSSGGGAIGLHCQPDNAFSRSLLVYAGIAQGVPDFPYQDESEVHDSTRATARSAESALHVHPRFMLEIAENWRSFEIGRPAIGTCPYLLLKWMVAVHDELIVTDMERRLDDTIYGGSVAIGQAVPLDDVRAAMEGAASFRTGHTRMVERNLGRRLELFRWTSIHRSGNLFRYPRERESLQAIQEAMGTDERFRNAHDLVDRLESLIEDVTSLRSAYAERRTNIMLAIIAVLSIISVAHDFDSEIGGDEGVGLYFKLFAGIALVIVAGILVAGPIRHSMWGKRSD